MLRYFFIFLLFLPVVFAALPKIGCVIVDNICIGYRLLEVQTFTNRSELYSGNVITEPIFCDISKCYFPPIIDGDIYLYSYIGNKSLEKKIGYMDAIDMNIEDMRKNKILEIKRSFKNLERVVEKFAIVLGICKNMKEGIIISGKNYSVSEILSRIEEIIGKELLRYYIAGISLRNLASLYSCTNLDKIFVFINNSYEFLRNELEYNNNYNIEDIDVKIIEDIDVPRLGEIWIYVHGIPLRNESSLCLGDTITIIFKNTDIVLEVESENCFNTHRLQGSGSFKMDVLSFLCSPYEEPEDGEKFNLKIGKSDLSIIYRTYPAACEIKEIFVPV